MDDLRSVVRGVILQTLYELDTTSHQRKDVLVFRDEAEVMQDDDVRLLGYLALRLHHQGSPALPPPKTFDLRLNLPLDSRNPIEQVLIDFLTEGITEETLLALTDEDIVQIESEVLIADAEEFDLRTKHPVGGLPPRERRLVFSMVNGILENREDLDELIHLFAADWPIDQIAVIDRNVLRLAIFEIGVRHTPLSVAINEAVDLAKTFGAESSPRFVNGVLSALSGYYDDLLERFQDVMLYSQEEAEA